MPIPQSSIVCCSHGNSTRGVNPPAWSARQKRLPGRAKCSPVAAEYSPGLMPQNSTSSPTAIRSGMAFPSAARNCAGVGFGGGLVRTMGGIAVRVRTGRLLGAVAAAHEHITFAVLVTNIDAPRLAADFAVLHQRAQHVRFEVDLELLPTVRTRHGELGLKLVSHDPFSRTVARRRSPCIA